MDEQEPEERSLVNAKRMNHNCGQKKKCLVVQRKTGQETLFEKVTRAFRRVEFALTQRKKFQAVTSTRTKAEAKFKQEKARNVLIHNQDFQPLKTPLKRDKAIPGNQTIGILT